MGFFTTLFGKKAGGSLDRGFNKIGHTIKTGFTKVTHAVHKSVIKPIYTNVFKPVYHKVIKAAYNKVLKPITKRTVEYVDHGLQRVERIANAGTKGIEGVGNAASGIGNFLSNPVGILAAGAGVIVLASVVKK